MRIPRRLSALLILLVGVLALIATSGIAQASWVWCDDPILSVGNSSVGYTTVYVQYAADINGPTNISLNDYFQPSLQASVPANVQVKDIVPQSWNVSWGTSRDLAISRRGIQTTMDVLVLPKASIPGTKDMDIKIKVRVSLDPQGTRVLAWGRGEVGERFTVRTTIPLSGK